MNSTFLKTAPLLLAAGLALGGTTAAHAQVTINYSLGTYSFTTPNQYASFNLTARTNTLTLTPGVAQTVNIQGVLFKVSPTVSGSTTDYTGTLSRNITLNGITQVATQSYDLTTDQGSNAPDGANLYADDSLLFYPGSALTFNLGSQGTLKFTPSTIDSNGFFNEDASPSGGQAQYVSNAQGTFLLTPAAAVPEASSLVSTGILLTLGLGAFALRSRKRSATQA